MSRYRDTQLQVTENVCYVLNLSPNIYISVSRLKAYFIVDSLLSGVIRVQIKTQNIYFSALRLKGLKWMILGYSTVEISKVT